MVKLTVILVRDGKTEAEVRASSGSVSQEDLARELSEETVNDDLRKYISNQEHDANANASGGGDSSVQQQLTLSQKVDPALSEDGYWMAQETMTNLVGALSSSTPAGGRDEGNDQKEKRKIAFFTAPNRSCASTALMMTCADISRCDNLTWRLTTLEAASAPAAIPCVVSNGLCNGDPHVVRMAGFRAATEGGLFHCAAMQFNDGRSKCPFMKGKCVPEPYFCVFSTQPAKKNPDGILTLDISSLI